MSNEKPQTSPAETARQVEIHLREALSHSTDTEARYHIREAMQFVETCYDFE